MLRSGKTPEEIELQRKLLLMRFFIIAGNLVMVPFLIVSVLHQRWELATILALMIGATAGLVAGAHQRQQTKLTSQLLSILLWLFNVYLIVTGGHAGTGVYFAFGLVVLMIMIAGLRLGVYLGVSFLVVAAAAQFFHPQFAYHYPQDGRVRLIIALAFLVALSLISEWIHLQSYRAIKFTVETHRQNSLTDPLTRLVNRAGLERSLEQWHDPRQQASVALIDIDHFKQINDHYGHAIGDQALATVAKVLRNNLKQSDIVCRWGGEEFVLIFEKLSLARAADVVDQLRELLADRTINLDGQELTLQFSAGVAEFTGSAGFAAALQLADARVYQAKRSGRNRVVSQDEAAPSV
ncbi:GGDEF domain-containing protein [Saccharospirillum mangrovi]|uniref:GGDEF domain-containing protein n=1 Tax=Saccharospirillum mangrovi TaxID=2161747 RepID=UPI0013007572|nr:GGDEF domain-containing protein [Saccharospirillum mangrovi]